MTEDRLHKECKRKIEYYIKYSDYCKNLYSNINEDDLKDIVTYCFLDCYDFLKKHPEMKESKVISYFVRRSLCPCVVNNNNTEYHTI